MNSRSLFTFALASWLCSGLAWSAEPPSATAQLMGENCVRCHGAEVYTRAERRVSSLDGLHKQVRNCELMLGLSWFDEDVAAVSDHLNQQYYHFPQSGTASGSN